MMRSQAMGPIPNMSGETQERKRLTCSPRNQCWQANLPSLNRMRKGTLSTSPMVEAYAAKKRTMTGYTGMTLMRIHKSQSNPFQQPHPRDGRRGATLRHSRRDPLISSNETQHALVAMHQNPRNALQIHVMPHHRDLRLLSKHPLTLGPKQTHIALPCLHLRRSFLILMRKHFITHPHLAADVLHQSLHLRQRIRRPPRDPSITLRPSSAQAFQL